MSETVPAPRMRRAFLGVMALAFLAMAVVSVLQRMAQPNLVVPAEPKRMQAGRDDVPDDAKVISELMRKIQQDPGDVDAMIHLAEHFLTDGNRQAAENFLRRAVVAAPADARPLYLLGVTLHNLDKHEEAAACFERVLSLRDEPSARYSLGVLYVHYLHNAERGAEHLRVALTQPGLSEELAKLVREELNNLPPFKQGQAAPSKKTSPPEAAR